MRTRDFCTEEEITRLVHRFYEKVRQDERLGPIFDAHVHDWDHHLSRMVDFWSSTLRGTGRYRGTPMPRHVALPGLEPALFRRWLELFGQTTAEIGNPAMQQRADELAGRIADSLWLGYQMYNRPAGVAEPIARGRPPARG